MPFKHWTELDVSEVLNIAARGDVTLVLAHIERYLPYIDDKLLSRLNDNGVLFQANASFFSGFLKSGRAVKMLKENKIHFVGSDCHNLSNRAPNMNVAYQTIIKKLGVVAAEEFFNYGNELFLENKI